MNQIPTISRLCKDRAHVAPAYPKLIQVIVSEELVGCGTEECLSRRARRYYDTNGNFLAEEFYQEAPK